MIRDSEKRWIRAPAGPTPAAHAVVKMPPVGTACDRFPFCGQPTSVLQLVGWTPLLELGSVSRRTGCTVLAKMEYANPGGSVKDRIASFIVEQAEARGELRPGSTILEITSGNTGISLAMVGAAKGYPVVIRMPRTASVERQQMIRSFGATLELLDDLLRIQGAVAQAEQEAKGNPDLFLPRQFANPDNPLAHELGTGPEILRQTEGRLDAFVMGVGTGGTVMGVGRALRKAGVGALVVAVEPAESAVLSGGKPGRHGIQGLADGFIPEIVNPGEIDRVIPVPTDLAITAAKRLQREEGLLVGISAGANLVACEQLARELGPGRRIVTILPDRGERYLSVW